ncbi:RNA pseudouridine synthase 5 [Acorus gramineus]|uniref:RNA pseudouridine synthase 5 n=1 Tax=Acorus gramineus TaxID=55184 RepID=A0AAV9AQL3_ACOGR|nr:RNA pseudouridine synthase 5 [Acorus gramineus]
MTQTAPYVFGVPWPDLNEGLTYTDIVSSTTAGSTLIQFYSSNYSDSAPPQGWIQRIQNGQIMVDGQVTTSPDAILRNASTVVYHRLPWKEPYAPYLLEVLYEDHDMVALNKPSGLQVLPGGLFQQRTVLTQLQWHSRNKTLSQDLSHKQTVQKQCHSPVHRLGRGTSGILLCAKTKLAKSFLSAYFAHGTLTIKDSREGKMESGKTRRICKVYRTLVTGLVDKDEMEVKQPIGLMPYPGVAKGLYVASSSGKPALSKVRVLERDETLNHTLVQVEIQSGRPHQIRIHLSFIGHPLLGDPLYVDGGQPKYFGIQQTDGDFAEDGGYQRPMQAVPGDCGYYLHAHQLVLCHPTTNQLVEIIAPLPHILRTSEEKEKCSC